MLGIRLPSNFLHDRLPLKRLKQDALWFAVGCIAAAIPVAYGQTGPAQSVPASQPVPQAAPVFDVAAIRVNKTDLSGHSHIISSPYDSHFRATNVSLKSLLQWAFVIPDTRIVGGPSWLGSTKFDIGAKADPSVDEQMRGLDSATGRLQKEKMLQALLASRFQLQVHQESRELPIYALVVAKSGPKFQPSKVNGTTINERHGEIDVRGSDDTIGLLADALARNLGRVVVNQTGMKDRYELDLKWTPDDAASPRSGAGSGSSSDASGPSLFTAIQEQLGLKLEPQKGPVSVLVIDHVEMPSEN